MVQKVWKEQFDGLRGEIQLGGGREWLFTRCVQMSRGKLSRNTDVWASSLEALVQETWGELFFLYLCKALPLMLGAASAEDCGVASSSLTASGAYPVTQKFHFGVAPET